MASFAFIAPILFLGLYGQTDSLTDRNFKTYLKQHQCIETRDSYQYKTRECKTSKSGPYDCVTKTNHETIYQCEKTNSHIYLSEYKELYGVRYGIFD